MAKRRLPTRPKTRLPARPRNAELSDASLLDVLDNVLNNGVVLHGEVLLGVANVDLIYLKLSLLAAAVDKLSGERKSGETSKAARHPQRGR
jgi:hypothetical protein